MALFEIPTLGSPQSMSINLNGVPYNLTIKWNRAANIWVIDIYDVNQNPLVTGIPMIPGADLLAQYEYLEIGVALAATTDHDPSAPPTFTNLGTSGHLYFQPSS